MSYINIQEKDNAAIEKKELAEFERKRLRGTGYDMMKTRDRGWGKLHEDRCGGKDVTIEWHVDYEKSEPMDYETKTPIPVGKFLLTVGEERVLIDKQAFEKMFRWV